VAFEEVSELLSVLAERVVREALSQAERRGRGEAPPHLAVVSLGKLAGREFTYHSDLDLIFLYPGGSAELLAASRAAQRLIGYASTATGAGVAYAVDARLRPSGHQGMLVTSFDAYERYQRASAATWEHLVLVRARPVAGERAAARGAVERARRAVLASTAPPWAEVASMRARVERERAREEPAQLCLKTGPGGLMDAEFLAAGAALERGAALRLPALPSVPALLRALAPGAAGVLKSYAWLRRVESRLRWLVGRPVEALQRGHPGLAALAELVEPGLSAKALIARSDAARRCLRQAFERVSRAGSVEALAGSGDAR